MLVNLPCRMRNNEVYYNCSTKKRGEVCEFCAAGKD